MTIEDINFSKSPQKFRCYKSLVAKIFGEKKFRCLLITEIKSHRNFLHLM